MALAEVETPSFTPLQIRRTCCCQHHTCCMAGNAFKGAVNWKPLLSQVIVAICSPTSLNGWHWNRSVFVSKEIFLWPTAQFHILRLVIEFWHPVVFSLQLYVEVHCEDNVSSYDLIDFPSPAYPGNVTEAVSKVEAPLRWWHCHW